MSAAAIPIPITPDLRQQRARQHDRVLSDPNIRNEKTLYTVLLRLCWVLGKCKASLEYLSRRTGIPKSTLRRHAKTLRSLGHIDWVQTGRENWWFVTAISEQSVCSKVSTRPAQDVAMPRASAEEKYRNTEKTTTANPPAIVEVPAPPVVFPKKAPIAANSPVIDLIAQEAGLEAAKDASVVSPEDAMLAVAAAHEYRQNNEVQSFTGLQRDAIRKRWRPNNPKFYIDIRKTCALATSTAAPGTVDSPPAVTVPGASGYGNHSAVAYPRCRLCGEETSPYESLVHDGSSGMIHTRCRDPLDIESRRFVDELIARARNKIKS